MDDRPFPDQIRAMSTLSNSSAINQPGQSRVVLAYGDEVHFHLTGGQTGGAFTLFTDITPPGGGPPPHFHVNEDELFFVLEGRISFFADSKWTEVPAGGSVYMPKGVLHTFKNIGDQPSKVLIRTSPSGFETFFARSEAEFKQPGAPDMKRLLAIGVEHGIHFPGLEAQLP